MASTTDCPSLVAECRGSQFFDGFSDIGWMRLNGGSTLAVAYSLVGENEKDVAFNSKYNWSTDGINDFDVNTVALHELGHVVGLGHSSEVGAVMEAVYAGPRGLHADDIAGAITIYGASAPSAVGTISGVVSDSSGTLEGVDVSTATGQTDSTDGSGVYTLTGVPAGSADVTASLAGYEDGTATVAVTDGNTTTWSPTLIALPAPVFGTISGVVSDSNGALAGVDVSTATGQSDTTDSFGVYDLTGVPAGSADLTASLAGYEDATATVAVTDGNTTTWSPTLTAVSVTSASVNSIDYSTEGGRGGNKHLLIDVPLVDGDLSPIAGAIVTISMTRDTVSIGSASGTTDAGGVAHFTVKNANGGHYVTTVVDVVAAGFDWDGVQPAANWFDK
jgi:hypothetical protein